MSRSSRTIYVGNLPGDIRQTEIEDLFYKYGRIVDIDLKLPPRPPGYAFVEFEDSRDAEDAIRGRDGYSFDGHRLRVEFAHSGGRGHSSHGGDRHGGHRGSGGGGGRDRDRDGGGRRGISRRTEFRVLVTNLPSSASWQDLKDHMRNAGDVCFAQVYRESNGTQGVVDFSNYEDMKNAIRKLDDTEFRNPFASSYIRVREDKDAKKSLSRSRSRSWSRGTRSRSRSHSRRDRSKSRSRSPARRSRSPARRSRSPAHVSRSRSASRSPVRSRSKSPAKSMSRSRSRSASPQVTVANNSNIPERSRSPSRSPKHEENEKSPARSPSPVSDAS